MNGVRVLSLIYVMMGHGYVSAHMSVYYSGEKLNRTMHPWIFAIVPVAFYVVDTFFLLSAFFATYLILIRTK